MGAQKGGTPKPAPCKCAPEITGRCYGESHPIAAAGLINGIFFSSCVLFWGHSGLLWDACGVEERTASASVLRAWPHPACGNL